MTTDGGAKTWIYGSPNLNHWFHVYVDCRSFISISMCFFSYRETTFVRLIWQSVSVRLWRYKIWSDANLLLLLITVLSEQTKLFKQSSARANIIFLLTDCCVRHSWRSTVGGTPVFGRRTDPVLRSTFSWRVTVTTMWVNRPLKISQLGQLSLSSFRVDKWVVSCN